MGGVQAVFEWPTWLSWCAAGDEAFPTLFLAGLGFQWPIAVGIAIKKGISARDPRPPQDDP